MSIQEFLEENYAKQEGVSIEEYRKRTELRMKINEESEKYMDTPPDLWPEIKFNWDISESSQRFTLDSQSEEDFEKHYPKGFDLGYVNLEDFDKKLCHFSRRDGNELWELGFKSRLAHLIVYLARGYPISPPLVAPTGEHEVVFKGGHHRYAIAKAIGENEIPIYVESGNVTKINSIINVRWASA